jgi:two-component sensor histidine kinase
VKFPALVSVHFSCLFFLLFAVFAGPVLAFSEADSPSSPKEDSAAILSFISEAEYLKYRNYNEARIASLKALTLAESSSCLECKAKALSSWALINWLNGEYPNALVANEKAIGIWKVLGNKKRMADNYHSIAMIWYYQSDYKQAVNYYLRCFDIYSQEQDSALMAKTLIHIALVYYKQADYREATRYLMQSYKFRENLSDYDNLTYNLAGLGSSVIDNKIYEEELSYLLSRLKETVAGKDSYNKATHFHNIGMAYYYLGNYSQSIKWLSESVYMMQNTNVVPIWSDLGDVYLKARQYDSARYYYDLSLTENTERGTRIDQVISNNCLGELEDQLGNESAAVNFFSKARQLNADMNNRLSVAENDARIARIYLDHDQIDEGILYAERSLRLARVINAGNVIKDVLDLLATLYSRKAEFAKSYQYHQELQQLTDSIINGRSLYETSLMTIRYETEKKQRELEKLEKQNEIVNDRLRFRSILFYTVSVLGIMLLTLAGLLYVKFRSNKKANRLLTVQKNLIEEKNRLLEIMNTEKEVLMNEIHHRVKNNLQVIISMITIQAAKIKDAGIRDVLTESQSRIRAIGLIHESLYKSNEFGEVHMKQYIDNLFENLVYTFQHGTRKISGKVTSDDILLATEDAITVGLILNELLTNALKYGIIYNPHPLIEVKLNKENNTSIRLEVSDNGKGMNPEKTHESFGYHLIRELSKKLDGDMVIRNGHGTHVGITFRKIKMLN